MKVSLITVCYNAEHTIADTIESVLSQSYPDIEYLIIDGASTDRTPKIVQSYGERITRFLSEPDAGIYDAMNKGIALATGDIVGIINSDDVYRHNGVVARIVDTFLGHEVECVFADLVYVHPRNLAKTVRYYDSSGCTPETFAYGWMPAHPTFFAKRDLYTRYGVFKTDYKIAADYELLTRLIARHRVRYHYIPEALITMRLGGISTRNFRSTLILNREIIRACRENGIPTGWMKVLSKYPKKLLGLLRR